MSGMSFLSTPTVCERKKEFETSISKHCLSTVCIQITHLCTEVQFCVQLITIMFCKDPKSRTKNDRECSRVVDCISPQPASWTPQSLWPWSGTVCRSPRPPCSHSSSSWSISLYEKKKSFACSDPYLHHWGVNPEVLWDYWPNRLMIPSL